VIDAYYLYESPFVIPKNKKINIQPAGTPYYYVTTNTWARIEGTSMRQYYYATYSDGEQKTEVFNDLKTAVRFFSRDVIGHTLQFIEDKYSNVLWHIEGGHRPKQPMAERAIENTTKESLSRFFRDYSEYMKQYISDPTTGNKCDSAGVNFFFEDGQITLKDAKGEPRKAFRIFIEEVPMLRHKFGKDFICEHCGIHMADASDPTGLCSMEERNELTPEAD